MSKLFLNINFIRAPFQTNSFLLDTNTGTNDFNRFENDNDVVCIIHAMKKTKNELKHFVFTNDVPTTRSHAMFEAMNKAIAQLNKKRNVKAIYIDLPIMHKYINNLPNYEENGYLKKDQTTPLKYATMLKTIASALMKTDGTFPNFYHFHKPFFDAIEMKSNNQFKMVFRNKIDPTIEDMEFNKMMNITLKSNK